MYNLYVGFKVVALYQHEIDAKKDLQYMQSVGYNCRVVFINSK